MDAEATVASARRAHVARRTASRVPRQNVGWAHTRSVKVSATVVQVIAIRTFLRRCGRELDRLVPAPGGTMRAMTYRGPYKLRVEEKDRPA
jgi:hypothetical protein